MPRTTQTLFSSGVPGIVRRAFRRVERETGLPLAIDQYARETFACLAYPQMDADFVADRLPPGRILLSGACEWTAGIVAAIELRAPDKTIVALVDRRAVDIRERSGYPVLTAAEAARLPFDYALVCNPVHEASMTQDLRNAHVPADRIVALRKLDAFLEFQGAVLVEETFPRLLREIRRGVTNVETVILQPSRDIWSVVADDELTTVFPPERTVRLYTGHPAQLDISGPYPSFDIRRSFPLLESVLRSLQPKHIYLRGSAQFQGQHLGVALRRAFPSAFLVVEMYDYMCMFEDELLHDWRFTSESIELNRCAEAYLGCHADFIIDKTPGDRWRLLVEELFQVPRRHYFPQVASPREAAPLPSGHTNENGASPVRLLCAGTFPAFQSFRPGLGFADSVFQDVITPIQLLSREAEFRIDVFNSGHEAGSADCEALFSGYRDYLDPDRVRYHPCVPFADLVAAMADYDYGILLFSPTGMAIDFPLQQSLTNRLMGYVVGALPAIVNTELQYCASLVETFEAGITVHAHEIADLPRRIREADRVRHRSGALRLKAFMAEHNQSALKALREAMAVSRPAHQPAPAGQSLRVMSAAQKHAGPAGAGIE